MISPPPMRAIQMRFDLTTNPSVVAPAPSSMKMSVKPEMKSSAWITASRRDLLTSSTESPVMNVT